MSESDKLKVRTAHIDLAGLDGLDCDALALGIFSDDRPLRSVAGFCDWRLNGRLSALVRNGQFACQPEEVMLTDTVGRIGTARVLLFGLGEREEMSQALYRAAIRSMLVVSRRANFNRLAIELPGTEPGPIDPQQALGAFFEVALKNHPTAEVTLMSPNRQFVELLAEICAYEKDVKVL